MGFELTIQDYPRYTYGDYEKWPGDWELIRGIPYAMAPAPAWQHQHFGGRFVTAWSIALREKGNACDCKVLYETDWVIADDTVVRPDVMIVCESISGLHVTTPPSLVLEILSPATVLKDRNTKFNLYQAYGVRYYLLADTGKKEVEVFVLDGNRYRQDDTLDSFQLANGCTVNLSLLSIFE